MINKLKKEDREKIYQLAKKFAQVWSKLGRIEEKIKVLQRESSDYVKTLEDIREEEELVVKEIEKKYPELKGKIEIPMDFLRDQF